jgi:hypothetical protein
LDLGELGNFGAETESPPRPCEEQNFNLLVFRSLQHGFQEIFYHFGVKGVQGPGTIQGDYGHPAFFLIKD